ncbi:MAG: B12-binding domain-containing radical SAM protein [Candidatus Hermodarchaeota archaeon]
MRALLLAMPNSAWAFQIYHVLPNLAITSLASNVEDYEVDVADLVLIRRNFKRFLETRISRHAPDIVGLSAMSFQAKVARYIARFVKQIDPEIKVALGGYHATAMAEEIGQLWKSDLDFIIRGEGESTFNDLLKTLDRGAPDLRDIKNLSFKKNGKFIHNPQRMLEDLFTLKPPKRSTRLLKEGFHGLGLKADVVESSRGCLHNCKFCSIHNMYGRSFRKFPIDRVLDDIGSCKKNGVQYIFFADDNITLDSEHFASLCDGIIERDLNNIHYSIQASVNGLYEKPELLKKIVDANFKVVFMGIENPDPKNLQVYGKNIKKMAGKAEIVVSNLRSQNIIVAGGLILGNPDDTERDFYNVLDYAKQIKLDLAIFFTLQPYPKTKIRDILLERELIFNIDDFSSYDGFTPNVKTAHLNREQIEVLREKIWSEFYNIDWLFWNNFRKLYPRYFFKLLVSFIPRSVKHTLYEITGMKTQQEIVQEVLQFEKEFRDLKR